ncbi:hypothetical protein Droror1_Dr00017281 [Drosera rotundifolia]
MDRKKKAVAVVKVTEDSQVVVDAQKDRTGEKGDLDRTLKGVVGEKGVSDVLEPNADLNGSPITVGRQKLVEFAKEKTRKSGGYQLSYVHRRDEEIVIILYDVSEACQFWKFALMGYVLGDHIPFSVMKAYVERNWHGAAQPSIQVHERGYYVFR